jgi:hypothetical protein
MRRAPGILTTRIRRCGTGSVSPSRLLTALGGLTLAFSGLLVAGADELDFDRHVAPILVTRCLECHNEVAASGGLVLNRADATRRGGDSGQALIAGDPDESLLVTRIADGEMPPERKGRSQKLPEGEIAILRQWIASGAKWPAERTLDQYERTSATRAGRDWWSLQPIKRPDVPAVPRSRWNENPIDAFVLSRLDSAEMSPAPAADRRTLVRRVYFDLVGLPPTATEVETFSRDQSADAYPRLVDRLLESPHYGERWARYWLDLVRFAETSGYERDQEKPGAWKYRDWVIGALNDDKPYDRFIEEQLAGDELPDRDENTVIATGFLRLGTWNDEPNDPEDYKYERLEDLVHATSSAFLGTTVKCARCHDHKFDPIRQTDYYRIGAAFWPGPIEPRGRELLGGPTRDELGYEVLGWTDVTRSPSPLHLLKKGESARPGEVVEPGVLSMIPTMDHAFESASPETRTTGRRLQLARWIVDPRHPLTARVYANRLWQHHFGQGLVRTPDNFGFTGDKPSHAALLDWLADELIRGGWTTKRLHRLIVLSQAYQQASVHPHREAYARRDPDNRLVWRAARRRLDAEALRDAILAVSGQLDLRTGGPSFKPIVNPEALEGLSRKGADVQPSAASEQGRRSVYMYSQRSLLPPLMTTFDFCDTTLPCGQRDVSVVAPQALALLNGSFAHEQSKTLTARVLAAAGAEPAAQVQAAWRLVLARAPSAGETEAALAHLERQRRHFQSLPQADELAVTSLCHALLNCNEFIFVD